MKSSIGKGGGLKVELNAGGRICKRVGKGELNEVGGIKTRRFSREFTYIKTEGQTDRKVFVLLRRLKKRLAKMLTDYIHYKVTDIFVFKSEGTS